MALNNLPGILNVPTTELNSTSANKLSRNSNQEKTFINRRQEQYAKRTGAGKKRVTKVLR